MTLEPTGNNFKYRALREVLVHTNQFGTTHGGQPSAWCRCQDLFKQRCWHVKRPPCSLFDQTRWNTAARNIWLEQLQILETLEIVYHWNEKPCTNKAMKRYERLKFWTVNWASCKFRADHSQVHEIPLVQLCDSAISHGSLRDCWLDAMNFSILDSEESKNIAVVHKTNQGVLPNFGTVKLNVETNCQTVWVFTCQATPEKTCGNSSKSAQSSLVWHLLQLACKLECSNSLAKSEVSPKLLHTSIQQAFNKGLQNTFLSFFSSP